CPSPGRVALTAARRLNNAITSWTDLIDLATYAWLASVMWVPAVAAWTMAWNRSCPRPWRSIDVAAVVLGVHRDHRRRDPFGERDQRQPARVDRVVCRDR